MSDTGYDDYDNPWKSAIDGYLFDFIAFYFPVAHANIDWSVDYESLDNELPALVRDAELGNRYADKLIKVTTIDGGQDIVYIHIEVQGQVDNDFSKRMYTYNYRIYDKFGRFPVSLAVLTDENEHWKPNNYHQQQWGCSMNFEFPVAKLTDYHYQLDELLANSNPFAILTASHILTKKTKNQVQQRYETKLKVIRLLYQKGWDKQELINFLAVIDWLMYLPEAFAAQLRQEVHNIEEEDKMRYVTSFEQLAKQEGMQQGMQQGIQQGKSWVLKQVLNLRFPNADLGSYQHLIDNAAEDQLIGYIIKASTAVTVDDIFKKEIQ
ncbi:MAG: hypothetical protein M1579_03230 [Gammaproteobacteria bacterium]|nr:hypothetical protein [Gammaproteobacteria bacterium]